MPNAALREQKCRDGRASRCSNCSCIIFGRKEVPGAQFCSLLLSQMSFLIPHDIPEHTGMYFSVVWLAGYPARTERNCSRVCSYQAPQNIRLIKEGSQNDRENLARKIGIYSPHWRAAWVVPDKRNASNQCEANRRENPIRKLSPVHCLHSWKILGVD